MPEVNIYVDCLYKQGVVVYAKDQISGYSGLTRRFKPSIVGADNYSKVYVNCSDYTMRCANEKLTSSFPECQVKGKLWPYDWRNPHNFGELGCTKNYSDCY